jgi:excisionase family DNA binding protein
MREATEELRRERLQLRKRAQNLTRLEQAGATKNGTPVATYFTVKEVAGLLGKHPDTVRNDIRAGHLMAEKLGRRSLRVSARELERYVEWLKESGS